MLNKQKVQNKLFVILRNVEDYLTQKSYTISRLQQQNCNWAITGKPQPNLESVCTIVIEDGFVAADLRPTTLVSALRDKKKDHLATLTKSMGLIKELINKSLYLLFYNKTMAKIQIILRDKFHHISSMSVSHIFIDACNVKLLEYKDIIDYISQYQIAFDKLISLISKDSQISKKSIKMTLERRLLQHLGKNYSVLVSAIKTMWIEKITNLSNTIFRIIRYTEINKGNKEDMAENTKVLAARVP